jgi:hypothetical protein
VRLNRFAIVVLLLVAAATGAVAPAASQTFEFDEFHAWSDIATVCNFTSN